MRWMLPVFGLLAAAAQTPAPPAPPPAIAGLSARAAEARQAGRTDEAVNLYRQAVLKAPGWQEGWWWIGTIEYGRDRYPQCRDAFRRYTALNPKASFGLAFLGLCEFQTRELARSLDHLESAVSVGLPNGEQVTDVAMYHLALLQTRSGNFERALQICNLLARGGKAEDKVIAVAGTAALRRAVFPHELSAADQEVAAQLGTALLNGAGRPPEETFRRFEEIVTRYPRTPNVHYTFSTVLLATDPDRAVGELKKELEISPDHLPALVSLVLEHLRRNDPAAARPLAERAVEVAPSSFVARACLGRVLLETENEPPAAAVRELEAAVKLAPDSPQAHFSLAAAYAKAGRAADARRERAEFARLQKLKAAADSPEAR
jgi:predicted Zn-dependent protease